MKQDLPEQATLTVLVHAPGTPEGKEFTWKKSVKVGDAAREAAAAFGLIGGTPTLLDEEGRVLDRNRPLVAEGVRDGAKLELVDVGGAV